MEVDGHGYGPRERARPVITVDTDLVKTMPFQQAGGPPVVSWGYEDVEVRYLPSLSPPRGRENHRPFKEHQRHVQHIRQCSDGKIDASRAQAGLIHPHTANATRLPRNRLEGKGCPGRGASSTG